MKLEASYLCRNDKAPFVRGIYAAGSQYDRYSYVFAETIVLSDMLSVKAMNRLRKHQACTHVACCCIKPMAL